MSERRLSHSKDVIGLIEAGYATHVPIAFTDIIPKGSNGTQIINVKGKNLGSVFKSQTSFSIEFTGLVPLVTVYQTEIEANNTAQLLMIIQGNSIPVSIIVATLNTSNNAARSGTSVENILRERIKDPVLWRGADERANESDILFIANGLLDELSVVANVGEYIKIKGVLYADEVIVGGSGPTNLLAVGRPDQNWSYLS
jgi:hypothetical protein